MWFWIILIFVIGGAILASMHGDSPTEGALAGGCAAGGCLFEILITGVCIVVVLCSVLF